MILNEEYIKNNITNNQLGDELIPVPYRWSHGATDLHLGDGLLIYALIQHMRCKVCVCIGSGGGFIPRIMTQARIDLHSQRIFEGNNDVKWGDIGTTYLVDANNGIGGKTDWVDKDSFFRTNFGTRIILDTSENAYYNFFVKQDIKIDYLHIDGDHSYEGVKKDFELYSTLLSDRGIVSIHDTDINYHNEFIKSDDIQDEYWQDFSGPSKFVKELMDSGKWEVINLFNNGVVKNKPSSSGFTIISKIKSEF
jgi:hypothetical protein